MIRNIFILAHMNCFLKTGYAITKGEKKREGRGERERDRERT